MTTRFVSSGAAGQPTVLDVAREAGVSASTVSRILNGTARVADAKRAAVEEAVRRLNYRPNPAARSLKMGVTMTAGVIAPNLDSAFFARAMVGIEEGLGECGYAAIILSGNWNAVIESQRIQLLIDRRVDGLFVIAGSIDDASLLRHAQHVPIVAVGRQLDGPQVGAVHVDQQRCGYLATRHLLGLGHRRIAQVAGPARLRDAVERDVGYRAALAEAGLPHDPALVEDGDFSETGGVMAMNRLLDRGVPFTAVFAANDQSAMGAQMALIRRGLRVPDDVSIVGVDDVPAAAYMNPPLTTVRQPGHAIGLCASHVLMNMLGHEMPPIELPRVELVVRETTRRR